MPAQPWVTGPTHIIWDGQYLGTAERTPYWQLERGFTPLMNDLAGPVVPYDMLAVNKYANVIADLTRWDWNVLKDMQAVTSVFGPGQMAGTDIGTLMIHEDKAKVLNLDWPYSSKPAYAGMPPGVKFFKAWLAGPDNFDRMGTNPKRVHLAWYCLSDNAGGDFRLFEYEASGVAPN